MKRFFYILFPLFFISATPVFAQPNAISPWTKCIAQGTKDVATLSCIPIVLQNLINFLAIFAGAVAVMFIVFAGFKFITSQGDPEKVASARRMMVYVLWGAIIVILSFAILMLISRFTGVQQLAPGR